MELNVTINYDVIPRHRLLSYFHLRGNFNSCCSFYRSKRVIRHKLRRNLISLHGATMRMDNQTPSLNEPANEEGKFEIVKSGFVEVISIGGRKDAVVEFCLDSHFSSTSLRFWNIVVNAELHGQLQQRFIGKDVKPNVVEVADFVESSPKAVILIAGSGYGRDYTVAIDILRKIRSVNGFSVAITLKPFKFEGQKRVDEVSTLVGELQEYTSFCIDIDGNMLLNKELVTLDEAIQTVNSSVILAINMVSAIFCERHRKLIDVPHSHMREFKDSEIVNIFQGYKEAKVGFGGGSDIRNSVSQAIYGCPFINAEDLDGFFVCGVASSEVINDLEVQAFWHDFRQTTDHAREIITYLIHEPTLEKGMIVTTVVIFSSGKQEASEKSSAQKQPSEIMNLFSKLAQHFAFFSNFVKGNHSQSLSCNGSVVQDARASVTKGKSDYIEAINLTDGKGVVEEIRDDFNSSRFPDGVSEVAPCDGKLESDHPFEGYMDGSPFQQEAFDSWTAGPGHHMAESWAKERASKSGAALALDNIGIYCLPVGIRPSDELMDGGAVLSANKRTGSGFGEGYSSAPAILKINPSISEKQRVLSARAASMLEAERDLPKKWTPIVKIQYRGGVYQGRCQGGLPEGKGRLVLGDGSIYDGMWRNGKRSGSGTFYFSNGDVFQGSWREDLIHGKGWFYFHTGDRWFANFWKGKASGEGRFYSKAGDVFFGNFECGWRHGQFLCIYVDGTRWIEIWNEGVLVSRKQLDNAQ